MENHPPPPSNFTLATTERQLVILVRDLIADYHRQYGGIPPADWILRRLGER